MKTLCVRLAAVAGFGILLSTSAFANSLGVGFVETIGAGPDTLTVVNFPTAIVTGTTDHWFIELPGITLSGNDLPQAWVEASGENGLNVLSIKPGATDTLILDSEALLGGDPTPDSFCGTHAPLGFGVSCFIGMDGNGNSWFASVTEVTAATPLPAALPLFATGLGGLGLLGWRRKRKVAVA